MNEMIEAELPMDLPLSEDSGYRALQAQLQKEYAAAEKERQIRYELMLEVYKIPPPGKKVKLFLNNGLGVHEGALQLTKQPEWPYEHNKPLLLQLERSQLELNNNPTPPFQFLHTDIDKWVLQ